MASPSVPAPLDGDRLAEVCEGDREFERELLDEYLQSIPALIRQAQEAVEGQDPDQLRRAAHTLKGASSSVGATAVYQTSLALELSARENRLDDARTICEQLCESFAELKAYMPVHFGEKAA